MSSTRRIQVSEFKARCIESLHDVDRTRFVSAISTLEIARLAALGQLELAAPVASCCERAR